MNEKTGLAFVYDIIHRNPNDEKETHFQIHNLIPDETIKLFLGCVFTPNDIYTTYKDNWNNTYTSTFASYKPTMYYYMFVSFMKTKREVKKTDTIDNNWDEFKEITSEDVNYSYRNYLNRPTLDKKTNKIIFSGTRDLVVFKKRTTLTGIFLMANNNTSPNTLIDYNPNNYCHHVLISEAMFPKPINMEINGTINVSCGCIVTSA